MNLNNLDEIVNDAGQARAGLTRWITSQSQRQQWAFEQTVQARNIVARLQMRGEQIKGQIQSALASNNQTLVKQLVDSLANEVGPMCRALLEISGNIQRAIGATLANRLDELSVQAGQVIKELGGREGSMSRVMAAMDAIDAAEARVNPPKAAPEIEKPPLKLHNSGPKI